MLDAILEECAFYPNEDSANADEEILAAIKPALLTVPGARPYGVSSPYARRGAVVSTQYNTTSIIRTTEQILGLSVMNQFDASATPMFDCFREEPDFTPVECPTHGPLHQGEKPLRE